MSQQEIKGELSALVERIAARDRTALRTLYEKVGPALHTYIQTKVRDPHEAADALQETFLVVWERPPALDTDAVLKAWLYRVARNKAIDRVRKLTRETPIEPDDQIADPAMDPERVCAAASDESHLHSCLAKLSPPHRAAIHLAYFEGYTYSEIAAIEGCAVGTVKTRVHHAKKLLKHWLSSPHHVRQAA